MKLERKFARLIWDGHIFIPTKDWQKNWTQTILKLLRHDMRNARYILCWLRVEETNGGRYRVPVNL
jgi:hypothetical protein